MRSMPGVPADESWEASKKMRSASRAFSEVRHDAESKVGIDRTPLLEEVTIQVGGDDPFQAAKFVSQRPGFKAREDAVMVGMQYKTRTDDGAYSAEFRGSASRFRDVITRPDSFGDDRETIQFRSHFDEPEPITTSITTSSLPWIMTSMQPTSTSGSKGVARSGRVRR
jgi:hypothetical protein